MENIIELKTKNKVSENKLIYFDLLDGPFRRLNGSWTLTEINENVTSVKFNIDYELKNFLLIKLVN